MSYRGSAMKKIIYGNSISFFLTIFIFFFLFTTSSGLCDEECPGPNQSEHKDSPYNFTYESWVKERQDGSDYIFGRCVKNKASRAMYFKWGKLENELDAKKLCKAYNSRRNRENEIESVKFKYGARLKEIDTEVIKPRGETDYAFLDMNSPRIILAQFTPNRRQALPPNEVNNFIQLSMKIYLNGEKWTYLTLKFFFESKLTRYERVSYKFGPIITPKFINKLKRFQYVEKANLDAYSVRFIGNNLANLFPNLPKKDKLPLFNFEDMQLPQEFTENRISSIPRIINTQVEFLDHKGRVYGRAPISFIPR